MQQLESLLQKSAVVVGLRYQGLTVKQIQEFRRSLPADSKMLVCKNTLMRVAIDRTDGWEELKPATKGDNAWLFVNEEVGAGLGLGGLCMLQGRRLERAPQHGQGMRVL